MGKVLTYGATGNGSTKDTAAIQKAINACAGGGTVQFPAGRYLTAPFFLTSSVILDVESGATMLGSTTTSDYTVQSGQQVAISTLSLINSDGVSNITINGGGVIDGLVGQWLCYSGSGPGDHFDFFHTNTDPHKNSRADPHGNSDPRADPHAHADTGHWRYSL